MEKNNQKNGNELVYHWCDQTFSKIEHYNNMI